MAEVVALAELFADDPRDIVGVVVVLGENERFGDLATAREDLGKELVAEGANDQADLVLGHYVAVEVLGRVGQVVFQLGQPLFFGPLVPMGNEPARFGLKLAALFADLGADAVDIESDVHAVGHRLVVAVFHHHIVTKKADRLLGGRGGQADQEGVEVFEDLTPEVVDRSVAFVDNDEIVGLDGDSLVVDDRQRPFDKRRVGLKEGALFVLFLKLGLALED